MEEDASGNCQAKELKGKLAFVTGASKGLGASIAKQLVAEGAAVVVNNASSKERADRVVAAIARNGVREGFVYLLREWRRGPRCSRHLEWGST